MWSYFSFVLFYFYTVRASDLLGNDLEYSENVENGQKVNFTGYRLVQATPQTSENLKLLKELDQQVGKYMHNLLIDELMLRWYDKHDCKNHNLKNTLHRGWRSRLLVRAVC